MSNNYLAGYSEAEDKGFNPKKIYAHHLIQYKNQQQKFACLTAYDYIMAELIDQAGIEVILVGDSLVNVFQGLNNTAHGNIEDMCYHIQIVQRAVKRALIIGDMPFGSYHISVSETMNNAVKLIKAGAEAIKLEGCNEQILDSIKQLVANGIPVIGHLGYTPQSQIQLGAGRIQGKDQDTAEKIILDAKKLEEAGVSALVLELIPHDLANKITQTLKIPTIGIGAGVDCDSQILVSDDMLGRTNANFSFVKKYLNSRELINQALNEYHQEVKHSLFPIKK